MNSKERILSVLNHEKPDRMPCFGANSTVTFDQMEKVRKFWPEGHENGEAMARQAMAAHTVLGFDAVRVPFSQTFEAEALGCRLKPGGRDGIPGVDDPPPYNLGDTPALPDDFLFRGQFGVIDSWYKAGIPVEFHLYQNGGHGFGLGNPNRTSNCWFDSFTHWLDVNGFLTAKSGD